MGLKQELQKTKIKTAPNLIDRNKHRAVNQCSRTKTQPAVWISNKLQAFNTCIRKVSNFYSSNLHSPCLFSLFSAYLVFEITCSIQSDTKCNPLSPRWFWKWFANNWPNFLHWIEAKNAITLEQPILASFVKLDINLANTFLRVKAHIFLLLILSSLGVLCKTHKT